MVTFRSQLTTLLYKLAVHRAIFACITSSKLATDITSTRNHAHLGTQSTYHTAMIRYMTSIYHCSNRGKNTTGTTGLAADVCYKKFMLH